MFVSDLRLKFARDLIGHWLDIRAMALVPLEENFDPRELLRCFDSLGIADLPQPGQVIFGLSGASVNRRFGRNIRRVNWLDLVPPILGDAGDRACKPICSVPCGYYHKFTAARDGAPARTAETLALPLRRHMAAKPHAVIAITRDVGEGAANPPDGWLTPSARVEDFFSEFVDIGAGVSHED